MKKTILLAVASVIFSGCNSIETSGETKVEDLPIEYKSVMTVNDTVFGETSGKTFDMGGMLYIGSEKVGFVDIDGIVYRSVSEDICGGEVVSLCIDAIFNDDNTLARDCNLSQKNDIAIPGEPALVGPAVVMPCGERII